MNSMTISTDVSLETMLSPDVAALHILGKPLTATVSSYAVATALQSISIKLQANQKTCSVTYMPVTGTPIFELAVLLEPVVGSSIHNLVNG